MDGVTTVTVARGCVKDGLKTYGDRVCEADDEQGICNDANGETVKTKFIVSNWTLWLIHLSGMNDTNLSQ